MSLHVASNLAQNTVPAVAYSVSAVCLNKQDELFSPVKMAFEDLPCTLTDEF